VDRRLNNFPFQASEPMRNLEGGEIMNWRKLLVIATVASAFAFAAAPKSEANVRVAVGIGVPLAYPAYPYPYYPYAYGYPYPYYYGPYGYSVAYGGFVRAHPVVFHGHHFVHHPRVHHH
jgi:hypothetical protein